MSLKQTLMIACAALEAPRGTTASAQSAAPGQSKADYLAWLARSAENRQNIRSFRSFLTKKRVLDILPVWQLVRTSSSWRECSASRFEVAPAPQWSNTVGTLAFVQNEVRPAIGKVEALSAFRDDKLNSCSKGKPRSAHRLFFAVDLVPVGHITRNALVARLCKAHAQQGAKYRTGLGFYTGSRFHVDSDGFRKWGADGRSDTSPCE